MFIDGSTTDEYRDKFEMRCRSGELELLRGLETRFTMCSRLPGVEQDVSGGFKRLQTHSPRSGKRRRRPIYPTVTLGSREAAVGEIR